jgi:hypothetical protein
VGFTLEHDRPWEASKLTLELAALGCVKGGKGHLFGLVRHVLATLIDLVTRNLVLSYDASSSKGKYHVRSRLMGAIASADIGPIAEISTGV